MLPVSVVSLAYYLLGTEMGGALEIFALRSIPVAVVGGGVGSFLLGKLKFKLLSVAFSLLVIVSGVMMIFG